MTIVCAVDIFSYLSETELEIDLCRPTHSWPILAPSQRLDAHPIKIRSYLTNRRRRRWRPSSPKTHHKLIYILRRKLVNRCRRATCPTQRSAKRNLSFAFEGVHDSRVLSGPVHVSLPFFQSVSLGLSHVETQKSPSL